ncbi:MAG: hypothetical protein IJ784_15390 [Ruminiclostridium sp.]|nr:hypothetical protein [Ruminiclostridium sp.]
MEEVLNHIYSVVLTLGISIVGFFVKRSFDNLDKKADKEDCKKVVDDIKALRSEMEQKSDSNDLKTVICDFKDIRREVELKSDCTDVQKLADDLKSFRKEYATKEELKEIRSQMNEVKASVEFLKENAVRKSDFVRVTADITSKIDDLSSYLRGKL